MTWQKFYEIYDLYGEDENAWKDYLKKDVVPAAASFDLVNFIKGIDLDSIQKGTQIAYNQGITDNSVIGFDTIDNSKRNNILSNLNDRFKKNANYNKLFLIHYSLINKLTCIFYYVKRLILFPHF